MSGYLFEKAGVPLSPYQVYLKSLQEKYPVVSAKQIENASGESFHTDALNGVLKDAFLDYKKMQYYNLFDAEK